MTEGVPRDAVDEPVGARPAPAYQDDETPSVALPIDPDVEPQERVEPLRLAHLLRPLRQVVVHRWDVLALISLGGALGALARWGASLAWSSGDTGFPWASLQVNTLGSALLGLLMVLVHRRDPEGRYVRPFLAVGVLGGFTTFSTYALDAHDLVLAHRPGLAGLYLVGSVVTGLAAVWAGVGLGRAIVARSAPAGSAETPAVVRTSR